MASSNHLDDRFKNSRNPTQAHAEYEKLKKLLDGRPKHHLNPTFKIAKPKKRSIVSRTPPRRKLLCHGLPNYFLFEFASGYALFHARGVDDLPFVDFVAHEKYINRSDQNFTLKAFHRFSSTDDALVNMNAISNSTLTPQLKSFLADNLPKTIPGKGSKCMVATSNPYLALNILSILRLGVHYGDVSTNLMRGLRMKIDKFIDGLEPKDLYKQQRNLAHLYSRQQCTKIVAKSSKAISSSSSRQLVVVPRGRKMCTSSVGKSSQVIASTSLQQFVIVPHRFEGVFIAKGEDGDFVCTRNLVPGEALYGGEELIRIQNKDGTDVEYRVWNPLRSKLAAAILCGVKNICVKHGSRVLYLGNVCEVTVSYLSDLVGSDGLVYVVGDSDVVVNMVEKRPNVITIIENVNYYWKYRMVLGMVDVIFANVVGGPKDCFGMSWIVNNARFYLRAGGHYMIITQANNMDSTNQGISGDNRFRREFNLTELVMLEPIVRESVMAIGGYRVLE